jgi:hypothetical protein
MEEMRNAYKMLVAKSEGKTYATLKGTLRRRTHEDVDWTHLTQHRDQSRPLQNKATQLRVSQKAGISTYKITSFLRI